jgi:kynureninase
MDVLQLVPGELIRGAAALDEADPLAAYRAEFVPAGQVVAYLDGNSLGRPLLATGKRLASLLAEDWGVRLIRSWDERWMNQPTALGDLLGRVVLGAAPGQTVIADSTTVLLYKLVRAALAARPGRSEIIADTENFPTDRFVIEAIAAELGLTINWITPDPAAGVRLDQVSRRLCERTALVVLSHVAYKSAFIADLPAITAAAHEAGALALWDLCHSVGALELDLDGADADFAVGCTYKYLNGGPGSPAFGYVAQRLHEQLSQPIPGWLSHLAPFEMGPRYQPDPGIRRIISGTPPILSMAPLWDMLDLLERAGMARVRAKSIQLTEFAVELADTVLAPHGVTLASPRDPALRGGHIMLEHRQMSGVVTRLWQRDILPDFRQPRGLRAGLSPLSTSFAEVALAFAHIAQVLDELA